MFLRFTTSIRSSAPRFSRAFASSPASRQGAVWRSAAAVGVGALLSFGAFQAHACQFPILAESVKTVSVAGTMGGIERTLILIKPDGTQRGLVGEIVGRFEKRGFKLVAIKSTVPSKELASKHYEDLSDKPFYGGLIKYMTAGQAPVIAMVWEGKEVIKTARKMMGATNPIAAEPGTIRFDYAISMGRNIIHGSDSFDSATNEIGLWFTQQELIDWKLTIDEWVNSAN